MMRAQMPTNREVLDTTIALEKESMALYARFSRRFTDDPKLKEFWFGMARDEARHVGALDLVSTMLDLEGRLDQESPVSLENEIIAKLRATLERYRKEPLSELSVEKALAAALEIEETELEDLVADLIKSLQPNEYERSLRMLVHDLGELSYMIECHSQNPDLLRRCDELVNRHAESLSRFPQS